MAYTLQGIFYLETEADILTIKGQALALYKAGVKTPMTFSIGGQNGSKQFLQPPNEILLECIAALRRIDPTTHGKRVTMLVADFSNTSFA